MRNGYGCDLMKGCGPSVLDRLRWQGSAWAEWFRPQQLPMREEPVRLNLVVHTELLAHEPTWRALLGLAGRFRRLTGERLTCCVTTPRCPQTRYHLGRFGASESVYAARVRELAVQAEIGYHGHFFHCRTAGRIDQHWLWGDRLVPMRVDDYDATGMQAQVMEELAWLRAQGCAPTVYAAGWWVLTAPLLEALKAGGIRIDTSVRGARPDRFGHRYMNTVPEPGAALRLSPGRQIIGIQSLFGPISHPWRTLSYLRPIVGRRPKEPLYGVFHIHDFDLPGWGDACMVNLERLSLLPQFCWMEVGAMAMEVGHTAVRLQESEVTSDVG